MTIHYNEKAEVSDIISWYSLMPARETLQLFYGRRIQLEIWIYSSDDHHHKG